MQSLGRALIFFGIILVLVGTLLFLAGRFGLPLGRLPGDISFRGKNFFFFAPLTTMILVSVILTVILNLILRWFR